MLREIRLDPYTVDLEDPTLPKEEWHREDLIRFFERVWIFRPTDIYDDDHPCWLWVGETDSLGNGLFVAKSLDRKGERLETGWFDAHRWIYSEIKGPILPDQLVSHECDNPDCVRPEHLFVESESRDEQVRAGRQVVWGEGGLHSVIHRWVDNSAREEVRERERYWQEVRQRRRETGLYLKIGRDLSDRFLFSDPRDIMDHYRDMHPREREILDRLLALCGHDTFYPDPEDLDGDPEVGEEETGTEDPAVAPPRIPGIESIPRQVDFMEDLFRRGLPDWE